MTFKFIRKKKIAKSCRKLGKTNVVVDLENNVAWKQDLFFLMLSLLLLLLLLLCGEVRTLLSLPAGQVSSETEARGYHYVYSLELKCHIMTQLGGLYNLCP